MGTQWMFQGNKTFNPNDPYGLNLYGGYIGQGGTGVDYSPQVEGGGGGPTGYYTAGKQGAVFNPFQMSQGYEGATGLPLGVGSSSEHGFNFSGYKGADGSTVQSGSDVAKQLFESGAITSKEYVDWLNSSGNFYQPNAKLNADGTISYDAYLQENTGFDAFMADYGWMLPLAAFAAPAVIGAAGAGAAGAGALAGDAAMFAGANAGGLGALTGAAAGTLGAETLGSLATSQGVLSGSELAAAIEAGATGVEGAAMEYAASVGGSVTFNPATGELLTVAGQAFNPAIDYAAQALQKFNPITNLPRLPTSRPGGESARDLAEYGNAGDLGIPKGVEPGMWSRVIGGSGTLDDFAKIFGGIAPAVMGWFASNKNTEALENFTNQWMSMGQGYRDQLANLYTQGGMDAWANSPQVQTTLNKTLEGAARTLSVEGNPALNPFAQNTMRDEGLNKMWEMLTGEKQFLATAGGLGSFNAAAPQMALAQINSGNNAWNAIGSGLSSVLNPQPTLEDYFKMMQQYGMTWRPAIA